MANFKTAYEIGEKNEGGYANVKGDRGGETYKGIARNFWPDWAGWGIIDAHKPLMHGQILREPALDTHVADFYKANFWDKMRGDGIASQDVATYLYDWFINAGANAIIRTQKMLDVVADGDFGPKSLAALNAQGDGLLSKLHEVRVNYYKNIAKNNSSNERFLAGWLNRANGLYNTLT